MDEESKEGGRAPAQEKANPREQFVRMQVRLLYDFQKLRIASANRNTLGIDDTQLTDKDREYLGRIGSGLEALEKDAEKAVKRALKGVPIWEKFLKDVKGIGPRLAGFLISELNPESERCGTVSKLWAWCGLHVEDGQAARRKKGVKAKWDPKRKAKLLKVLGDEFLLKKTEPYYTLYLNYKHRKESQIVPVCMACNGRGKGMQLKVKGKGWILVDEATEAELEEFGPPEDRTCYNCNGTGGPVPWGRSVMHRHVAAVRYMVKQFLRDYYIKYRELAGLPIRPPYHVEKLGMAVHER